MRPVAQRKSALNRFVVTVAASAAGLALLYGLFGAPGDDFETSRADEQRGYYVLDATLTEMGADGTPRIVVRAKSIEQQLADQSVLLSDLARLQDRSPGTGR
jgi:hypothetical protein